MNSIKKQARFAGLLYLLAAITAPFGLIFVPRALIVPGDATATADRVRTSGTLLRLGIADEIIVATLFILVVLALYHLLKEVHAKLALAMVTLFLVSVPISFLNVLNSIAAAMLANGAGFLSVFSRPELDALAYLFLTLHDKGLVVASIFWGLWLFPFGLLVMRSRLIPRFLGALLIMAGSGYLISSLTSLLLPQAGPLIGRIALVLEFGELPIIFWLLIWGVRERPVRKAG